jgi:hypothetical protein
MQSYGSNPPRIGSVAPKTGLVGKAMGDTPIKKDPNRVSVKAHTRVKAGKK